MTRADKAVAAAVLAVAALAYAVFAVCLADGRAVSAEVYVDGKEFAVYRLSDFPKAERIVISSEFGRNELEISKDGVRMTDADCPDKTDVKCGKITKPNRMLICAPNRVTVRLVGGASAEVDGVTY